MNWFSLGCYTIAVAIITGAFAAHGLDEPLAQLYAETPAKMQAGMEVSASWKYLQDFKTAAQYQVYCGVGLLALGLLPQTEKRTLRQFTGWMFLISVVLFSGSLYVLVLTGLTWLGAITPLGGLTMIAGWTTLGCLGWKSSASQNATES